MSAQVSRNVAADQMTACRLDASVMRAAIKTRTVSPAIARSSLGRLADWSDSRHDGETPVGDARRNAEEEESRDAAEDGGEERQEMMPDLLV